MRTRLALERDRSALRELAIAHLAEIRPDLAWNDARAEATFERYLKGANPTIFVVEHAGEVVGYVNGVFYDYAVCSGFYIVLDVIYVRPDKRGTRAAAKLMITFNDWTDSLKPNEVLALASNPKIAPNTLRFLKKFGFHDSGGIFERKPGR